VSERRACRVLGQSRTCQRYQAITAPDEGPLTAAVIRLASQYGRYGYRRITALLRAEGRSVDHKRVEGIWRRDGLKLPLEAIQAGSALAQRRILHPAQAELAPPCLGLRLGPGPHP